MKSLMEHQGRGTLHVRLAVCREFVKENSLIRDRFGSRALAHLLRCERRLKRMEVIAKGERLLNYISRLVTETMPKKRVSDEQAERF